MAGGCTVLGCVAVLLCLAGLVRGQQAFYDNYAYTKVMADCLGQEVYHQYLGKVAAARRECGMSQPASVFGHSPFDPFTPFIRQQSRRRRQVGGVLFARQPTVFHQQPGTFSRQPGTFSRQPGTFSRQPGIFSHQPGTFSRQPGIFSHQPGTFSRQPGIFTPQFGVFPQQSGVFPPQRGVAGRHPQVFGTAGVPSRGQGLPFLPNNSQRWAQVLGPSEIQEAKNTATALMANLTCVLTRLGVVNDGLDINYDGITLSVFNMAIDSPLKNDFISSIEQCRDLTLCLPVEKRQRPEPHQLQRLLAFLRCEKEARLMACLKHDLRKSIVLPDLGNLSGDGSGTDNLENLLSFLVSAKSANELQLLVELEAL